MALFAIQNKVLLHMQQGTAIKGIYLINCMGLHHGVLYSDEFYEPTKEALDAISTACVLADDESVPHECNQGIVFSSGMDLVIEIYGWYTCTCMLYIGVFSAMVNYVLGYCSGYGNDRQEELLHKATHALIRTVHKNETVCNCDCMILDIFVYIKVQKRLFEYFVDFLEVKSAISPVAQLLTEVIF